MNTATHPQGFVVSSSSIHCRQQQQQQQQHWLAPVLHSVDMGRKGTSKAQSLPM
jgi:hypothetical protein